MREVQVVGMLLAVFSPKEIAVCCVGSGQMVRQLEGIGS
jgi:hypothetical protein